MDDVIEEAINVATQVSARRSQGENVTDEEILSRYPHLSPFIEEQLRRIQSFDSVRKGPARESKQDFRFTKMVADDDEDDGEEFETEIDGPARSAVATMEIDETKPIRPFVRPAAALLCVYHDNHKDFESIPLRSDRTIIGRVSGDVVIEHDSLISSKHAEIARIRQNRKWKWRLKDLNSKNGTFVGINQAKLEDNTELILGSQRYRFALAGQEARLEHLVAGEPVDSIAVQPEGTWIGRCNTEMEAFQDEYLDHRHAFIQLARSYDWTITNKKSMNGVWYRIVSDVTIFDTCLFLLGEQRFQLRT